MIRNSTTSTEQTQVANALLSTILDLGEASTDDAHLRYELPNAVDQRTWGSVVAGLVACDVIQRVGDRHTNRPVAHGRRIGRYSASNVAKATVVRNHQSASAKRRLDRQQRLPGFDG